MYCSECGRKLSDNAAFCPFCGTRTRFATVNNKEKDAGAAGASEAAAESVPMIKKSFDIEIPADHTAPEPEAEFSAADDSNKDTAPTPKQRQGHLDQAAADLSQMKKVQGKIVENTAAEGAAQAGFSYADVPAGEAGKPGPSYADTPSGEAGKPEAFYADTPSGEAGKPEASYADAPSGEAGKPEASYADTPSGEAGKPGPSYADTPSGEAGKPEPSYADTPAGGRGPAGGEKKKGKGNSFGKIGLAVAAVLLAVAAVLIFQHHTKVNRYNDGVTQMENKNYQEALDIFTKLGSFDDSEYMAGFAQMELDYQKLDRMIAAGEYTEIADVLKRRSEYYADSQTGTEAAALAEEYEAVARGFEAKDSGNYEEAAKEFMSLETLKNDYGKEKSICLAHVSVDEQTWTDIILNLYAIQKDDYVLKFLDNPETDGETMLAKAYSTGEAPDADAVEKLLKPQDSEQEALKATALNGLRYDKAKAQLNADQYEDAMGTFEALGDFLDSKALYEKAKKGYEDCKKIYDDAGEYYDNGEYYKARKLYLSISDFKDSAKKAESCKQDLPENGSLKSGNGSAVSFTIYAAEGLYSAFVKIYDSDGDSVGQVFLRPGNNATLSMAVGTYTIKVGYGTEWYGEKDLFGEGGGYSQLLNGTSKDFSMQSGYSYSLELMRSTEGNVGSEMIDGAGSM